MDQQTNENEETKVAPEEVKAEEVETEAEATKETKEAKENEEYKTKFLYLAAEFENMKKRFEREKSDLLKYGSEKLLKSMVEVVDNFERTLNALKNDEDEKVKNIVVGIEMVHKLFISSLKNFGLEQINAVGEEFDPNFHEAMAQQPAEGKKDMEIIQEYEKGYILNGRLLRPSKVVVAKNS
jgi:molecular chaperone GrpE